jgi:hypothetical protein
VHDVGVLEAVHRIEAEEHRGSPPGGPVENLVTALVVILLGVAAVAGSLSLGAGSPSAPGSGTWPLVVSVVLVILGLVLLVRVRRTRDAERFTRAGLLVLGGLATMIVFVAVIGTIGFEIPTLLLAFLWLKVLGREGWRTSVITSIAIVVAFYLLFVALLSVSIPHLF